MINSSKSMLDLAKEQFENSKEPISFKDLWANIVNALELTEEEVAQKLPLFYTSLSLDGRFVVLKDDLWDLKSKHTFDEVHVDINDIYDESDRNDVADDEEGEDEESGEETKHKKVKKSHSDDEESDGEEDEENDDEEDSEEEEDEE